MKDKYKKMEPLKQITSFPKYQKDSYFFVTRLLVLGGKWYEIRGEVYVRCLSLAGS